MKKCLVALMALAAVAPLAAGTLADFSEGKGRAFTVASERFFEAPPEVAVVDDAGAPNGKALLAKIGARKETMKFARYDVVVNLTAEEAAKIREISFDAKVSDRKAFGWTMLYFRKTARSSDCIKQPIPNGKSFKIGEWQHFSFPVSGFKPEGKGIEMADARQFVITFFVYSPLEISVANIAYAE